MRAFNSLLVGLLLMTSSSVLAQEKNKITLYDADDSMPIVGATFQYDDQTGVSDVNGIIEFQIVEDASMYLSHISYGSWSWSPDEIIEILKEGTFYRKGIEFDLYPITVIAVKKSRQPDATLRVDYEDRMQHDGAGILNQIPAFNSVRKSGSYGQDPVFRGFKYDQLNVVFNGAQSATAACPNRMDPPTSQMAPNMMDRIEVLKGPHALRYGTGFGATINFVPTKLQFNEEPATSGRFSSGYEGNGSIVRSEAEIGVQSKAIDLRLFGSWSGGGDYTAGNDQTVQANFSRGSVGSNLGIKLADNQQLRLQGIYNFARDADFPALPMDLRDDDTWMFNARHDIQLDQGALKSWNTTAFGSFVDHLMNNLQRPLTQRNLDAATNATTFNYGARTEGVWQFSNSKLFTGADLRVEGAEGIRTRTFLMGPRAGTSVQDNAWQDGQIVKTGLFSEYHIATDRFKYVLSTRIELNQSDINDITPEFESLYPNPAETQLNFSASAGIQRDLSKSITLGVWLGHAQRSGSLVERFINSFPVGQDPFELIGNPGIKPEQNNQLDIALTWNNEQTALSLDLFGSYMRNYITSFIDPSLTPRLPMSPGVRTFQNLDDAYKTGFEFNWNQQLFENTQHQLSVAYTYAQDFERNEALPEIPPMDIRYSLSSNLMENKFTPEVTFRYVLEQSRVSQEFGENVTPEFFVLDLSFGYEITNAIRINAGINNLFNENYFEHLNRSVRGSVDPIFAPGRNIFTNISVRF